MTQLHLAFCIVFFTFQVSATAAAQKIEPPTNQTSTPRLFTIQVEASNDKKIAESKVLSLTENKLDAFFTTFTPDDKPTIYRVNVGHFSSRTQAQKLRQNLISKFKIPADAFVKGIKETFQTKKDKTEVAVQISPETDTLSPELKSPAESRETEKMLTSNQAITHEPAPQVACPLQAQAICPSPLIPVLTGDKRSERFSISVVGVLESGSYGLNFPAGQTGSYSSSGLISGGFAILPEFQISDSFFLETGVMTYQRSYNIAFNNGTAIQSGTESYTALELPLFLFYKLSNHLKFGLGPYFIDNPSGGLTTTGFGGQTLPDSTLSGNDWGIAAGLKYAQPISSSTDIILGGLFNYGSRNFLGATSSVAAVFNDYQIIAGLKFYPSE